jgi:NADH dehydrogenase [ubiquinone] 1 alpha subcomplex assembly factor 5
MRIASDGSQQRIQIPTGIQRGEIVRSANVGISDENLRHGGATRSAFDHLPTFGGVHGDVYLIEGDLLGRQQCLRSRAIRAQELCIDFDFGHHGLRATEMGLWRRDVNAAYRRSQQLHERCQRRPLHACCVARSGAKAAEMTESEIFSRTARRQRRNRAARSSPGDQWLIDRMADEVLSRFDAINRPIARALVIGGGLGRGAQTLKLRGIATLISDLAPVGAAAAVSLICEEDRLAVADRSVDLVMAVGTLDTVNDLPGALVLIRRALKPDGLFLGAFCGAGSLALLKRIARGQQSAPSTAARFHPQIDVRSAGDLLARAGFQLPVADGETVEVRYRNFETVVRDIRANGISNALAIRPPMSRSLFNAIRNGYNDALADGALETFGLIYVTGWAAPL